MHDRGSQDGQLWISMRFIDGTNAEKALAATRVPPPSTACRRTGSSGSSARWRRRWTTRIGTACCTGTSNRPTSCSPTAGDDEESERVFLSDFGVAKAIGEAAEQISSLTSTGSVVATLDYASPEQIKGQVLDDRSDIYALGCVLYKLLTGIVPFPGDSVAARVYGHLNNEPPPPSSLVPALPTGFDDVVAKAMAKEPDDRYPTCRALAAAATAALTSPVAAVPAPAPPSDELATTVTTADESAPAEPAQDRSAPAGSAQNRSALAQPGSEQTGSDPSGFAHSAAEQSGPTPSFPFTPLPPGQPATPSRRTGSGPPQRRSKWVLIAASVAALVAAASIAAVLWRGTCGRHAVGGQCFHDAVEHGKQS